MRVYDLESTLPVELLHKRPRLHGAVLGEQHPTGGEGGGRGRHEELQPHGARRCARPGLSAPWRQELRATKSRDFLYKTLQILKHMYIFS